MLIKKIFPLMKSSSEILLTDEAHQWIGTPSAMYFAEGLPKLDESGIMALLDVPAEKREKYRVEKISQFDFCSDNDPTDLAAERVEDLFICSHGVKMRVLFSAGRVYFCNSDYLKPFDDEESISLYIRDKQYIAVKCGFICKGVIVPTGLYGKTAQTLISIANKLMYDATTKKEEDEWSC